jgi:CheY-like chemotaxis protein
MMPYTLDLNMPDIHGLEFLQFVRNQKAFQEIPIVVITTHSDEQVREAVLSAGANGFITKPFTPQMILSRSKGAAEIGMSRDPWNSNFSGDFLQGFLDEAGEHLQRINQLLLRMESSADKLIR